jgi:anti-sigma regulatory factor (Ser/Thr protein kinase)
VLGAFAEALRLPDALVEDLRLAVTEACTNVVRHAYAPGAPGPVEVSLQPGDDVVHVVVSDRGRGVGTSADGSGPGLGLPLIAAIADEVDLQPVPGGGSRLAMTFARDRAGDVA